MQNRSMVQSTISIWEAGVVSPDSCVTKGIEIARRTKERTREIFDWQPVSFEWYEIALNGCNSPSRFNLHFFLTEVFFNPMSQNEKINFEVSIEFEIS